MIETNETNLTGIIAVVSKWKRPIFLLVIIATSLAAVTSLLILPRQYYAGTTVLPVNAMLTDKGRLFNNNIQELYSVYGTADDLDRIYTIAKAGNVLGFVVDSLKLAAHFGIAGNDEKARTKAVAKLKKNVSITKTESGALQIDVWDKDADKAAAIANLIIQKTELLGNELLVQANQTIINKLQTDINEKTKQLMELKDANASSGSIIINTDDNDLLRNELVRDKKLLHEFLLASEAKQPSLMILEKAYPSLKADKPKHFIIIVSAFLLSFFFAVLAALVINRIKK